MNSIKQRICKNLLIRVKIFVTLAGTMSIFSTQAAISLDRTRVIFDGSQSSVSLNLSNQNKQLPYLAQAWIEDEQGKKIQTPLTVLPPVQRIEPGKPGQLKIQAVSLGKTMPQDKESLYYFNLREIPPKSMKSNTLQIALQTRVKLFYRPAGIAIDTNAPPPQEQLTLTREGNRYQVNNPTPYYVTIVDAGKSKNQSIKDFEPMMIPPKGRLPLTVNVNEVGDHPVLTYINDYGGRPQLNFRCSSNECKVDGDKLN